MLEEATCIVSTKKSECTKSDEDKEIEALDSKRKDLKKRDRKN